MTLKYLALTPLFSTFFFSGNPAIKAESFAILVVILAVFAQLWRVETIMLFHY